MALQRVIDNCEKDYSIKYLIRSLFKMLYKYAKKIELLDNEDKPKGLDIGKHTTKKVKTVFTKEEIQLLWDNKDNIDNIDTVLMLIHTCVRINELIKQENDKINFEERYMIRRK